MTANSIPLLSDRFRVKRGTLFGALIITALIAFEIFNYSSTDFALSDLLGELSFWGLNWATILAIAFCGIDFAGIARLFTPEQGEDEPAEVWYLFGAWLLAATMNAMLTWWGVSIAILNHDSLGNAVVSRETLLKVVPVFVAILVWLIRVLIIGAFSIAGDNLFSQDDQRRRSATYQRETVSSRRPAPVAAGSRLSSSRNARPSYRPSPKPSSRPNRRPSPEPTYEPIAARGQSRRDNAKF
ncbi:MAG: hypothetical protein U9O54_05990 [Chloroflexota bacterium]|nr:hypothetical protein [Chloroflexota bacterium]